MQAPLVLKLKKNIVVHPRLNYQNLPVFDMEDKVENLPDLFPFPLKDYHQIALIMDWDHRLPSSRLFGRLLGFYTPESFAHAQREIQLRRREIAPKNEWPEFDVHDFEDIAADESYLLHMNMAGEVRKLEFLSPWKNRFQEAERARIMSILELNQEYQDVLATRRQSCGPARLLMWVPPCVSGQPVWTADVRVLTFCEGPSFWGRFFLVDMVGGSVCHSGNFHVRS